MFLRTAYANAQLHIESLYEDKCTVYTSSYNDDTGDVTWTAAGEDIPCRLSFSSLAPNTQGEAADTVNQTVKLFLSSGVDVPGGSRIVVTRSTGHVSNWQRSGLPAVYQTHQEILLSPMEVYA